MSEDLSQLVQVTDTTEKQTNLNRCGVTVDDVWCQNKLIDTADDV